MKTVEITYGFVFNSLLRFLLFFNCDYNISDRNKGDPQHER